MSDWEIWLVVLLLFIATAVTRCTLWLVGHHINLPRRVLEALRYAPACAMAAIIVPDLLLASGHLRFDLGNYRLAAALVALVFYLVRRNMLQTIVLGMACFTILRLTMSA